MYTRPAFVHKKGSSLSTVTIPGTELETIVGRYIAGIVIGGHRVVRTEPDETIVYADKDDINIANDHLLGITNNAANIGDIVNVVTYGPMEELTWAWDPTLLLFLGDDGLIVQVAPVVGFSVVLGFVLTPTRIFVDIQRPIILA
jgi:hypothetical protein